MFKLGDLLTQVAQDGVTGWKIFFQQLPVSLLELDLKSAPEHLLLAPLPRVVLALDDIGLPHLVPSVIQDHLDLLVGWVLAALLQGNPPPLVDTLLAVEVGGVDTDEPLGVGMEL